MSGDNKGFDLKSLFIKSDDEAEDQNEPAAATSSASAPLLSSLSNAAPAATATATGPSPRALEMLKAAQALVPADNAQFKLDAAMKSLEALEADSTKRRTMATAVLQSQGISSDKIEADENEARRLMSEYLGGLGGQLEAQLTTKVTDVRKNAAKLRKDAEALITQATQLEAGANSDEANFRAVAADIAAAQAIVNVK